MSIVSLTFLLFVAATLIIYYIVPVKVRWCVLLLASLAFYLYSGPIYILYLLFSVAVSYLVGRKLGTLGEIQKKTLSEMTDRAEKKAYKEKSNKQKRRFLVLGIVIVVLELLVVKYTAFACENISALVQLFGGEGLDAIKIIAPLGCSFYTFTIIAYMVDIYRGKAQAQKNPLKYLLYVSYFPQIIQGPIPRYSQTAEQLFAGQRFCFDTFRDGALRTLYGVFKKMVLAAPLGVIVDTAFGDPSAHTGLILLFAAVCYSFQMYADFSGYVDIVSGVSEMFGVKLPPNFERPYFATSIPEFWRRWHISLSSWFREYVFYALSASKMMLSLNKNCRKVLGNFFGRVISVCIPVLFVWSLTGLWHGADWTYVMWGLFHGTLIMLSILFEPAIKKFVQWSGLKTESASWKVTAMLRTFMLCTLGRVFFRADSISTAFAIFKKIFTDFSLSQNITTLGLTVNELLAVAVALVILLVVSLIQEYVGPFREWFKKQNVWFRWAVLYVFVLFILLVGSYGTNVTTSFIYEQF